MRHLAQPGAKKDTKLALRFISGFDAEDVWSVTALRFQKISLNAINPYRKK